MDAKFDSSTLQNENGFGGQWFRFIFFRELACSSLARCFPSRENILMSLCCSRHGSSITRRKYLLERDVLDLVLRSTYLLPSAKRGVEEKAGRSSTIGNDCLEKKEKNSTRECERKKKNDISPSTLSFFFSVSAFAHLTGRRTLSKKSSKRSIDTSYYSF